MSPTHHFGFAVLEANYGGRGWTCLGAFGFLYGTVQFWFLVWNGPVRNGSRNKDIYAFGLLNGTNWFWITPFHVREYSPYMLYYFIRRNLLNHVVHLRSSKRSIVRRSYDSGPIQMKEKKMIEEKGEMRKKKKEKEKK